MAQVLKCLREAHDRELAVLRADKLVLERELTELSNQVSGKSSSCGWTHPESTRPLVAADSRVVPMRTWDLEKSFFLSHCKGGAPTSCSDDEENDHMPLSDEDEHETETEIIVGPFDNLLPVQDEREPVEKLVSNDEANPTLDDEEDVSKTCRCRDHSAEDESSLAEMVHDPLVELVMCPTDSKKERLVDDCILQPFFQEALDDDAQEAPQEIADENPPPRKGVIRQKTIFITFDAMEKHQLDKELYDVSQFYHESGWAARLAQDNTFANVTLGVIALNAVYIGVDADNNPEPTLANASWGFQLCEHLFFIFFSFEWTVRFLAFQNKRECVKDRCFVFDSMLCAMMFLETWILGYCLQEGVVSLPTGLIKMLRLLRLTRMIRLMRSCPELIAMLKGVRVASRAVGSALMMLIFLVYIFAIILHTVLAPEKDFLLASPVFQIRLDGLTDIMMTLLIDGTFMDNLGLLARGFSAIPSAFVRGWSVLILWVFVLMSALTVMNMLIGVLCEVVSAVASSEKENAAISLVKKTLLVMLKKLDEDGSGEISREELSHVFHDDDSLRVLASLEVDVKHLVAVLEMHYDESASLSINSIIEVILMLRGDRQPQVMDLVEQQKYLMWNLEKMFATFLRNNASNL
eukprot:TRINITY_DN45177_c0_g1_i1.p1 TRINITY_DN45177_c0_g1~~TRINITY_DN45177_c0_g1_i1.p1  ORF type:complete len:673 (+),score=104.26 TRINITY_DN45177_c0_g1_i1:116-2020(+)